jgi:DivIVA domain-containing protein
VPTLAWHDRRVLHLLWYGLLAIGLAVGLFAVAARFLPAGEQIAPPLRDEPPWDLPDRGIGPADVDAVRLPVALRGYRFAETDELLDRLADELRARDEEIARLRSAGCDRDSAPAPGPDAPMLPGFTDPDPESGSAELQPGSAEPESGSTEPDGPVGEDGTNLP